jgi:hypothetical protein
MENIEDLSSNNVFKENNLNIGEEFYKYFN